MSNRLELPSPCAILVSGGIDSAALLGTALNGRRVVYPLYVQQGYTWEAAELEHLRGFLDAVQAAGLEPLHVLDMPLHDLGLDHWALNGQGVPDADSPDDAVSLPARNLSLLLKAMFWCHVHVVPAVALGILRSNPFPDATPAFLDALSQAVNEGLGARVTIYRPFEGLSKPDVLRRARGLPLERTFSCLQPIAGGHCGACNKCAERRRAFLAAGLADPTLYAQAEERNGR